MAPLHKIQTRVDPEDLAVLRRLGQLSGVSADMIAKRVLEDVMPELRRVLEWAETLQAENDPAGRGYIVWSINFPDGELGDGQPTVQPSGGFVSLHVDGQTYISGNVLAVSEPEGSLTNLHMSGPKVTNRHFNVVPSANLIAEEHAV